MIITMTMNPAIDKTVEINALMRGGLNRINHVTKDAGGKGINVSKTIKSLGGESVSTGFLGGQTGETIRTILRELKIIEDFVTVDMETRVNTKVVESGGMVTELNESGPTISRQSVSDLKCILNTYLKENDLLILAGSVPNGVSKDIYKDLTEYAHNNGAKVFVDADGELFANALLAKPDIVKPNKEELEKYVGYSLNNSEEILRAGKILLEKGVKTVIISLGAEGAYFIDEKHTLYSPGLAVKVNSTVGAGDAMVAAFAYGMDQNMSFETCAKLAVATSAGAVTTVGTKPPTKQEVETLLQQVTLVKKCLKE